jgi:hypothetical protein
LLVTAFRSAVVKTRGGQVVPARPHGAAMQQPGCTVSEVDQYAGQRTDQVGAVRNDLLTALTAVVTATSSTRLSSDATQPTPHAHIARSDQGPAAAVNRRVSALSTEDDDVPPPGERVPPACPLPGSSGVNNGHSCHLPPGTRRSASAQVRALIAARPSKLGLRISVPATCSRVRPTPADAVAPRRRHDDVHRRRRVGKGVVGQMSQVPRHVSAQGIAGQGQGSRSFIACGAPPRPLASFGTSPPNATGYPLPRLACRA